jgi:tape measure domain-containing protein
MAFDSLEWRLVAKDEASATVDKVSRSFGDLEKASNDSSKAVASSGASWQDMAKGVFTGEAALRVAEKAFNAIAGVAMGAINEAARVESLTTSFEVMSGSAEKAHVSLKQLQQVAIDNPVLGLEQVQEGGKRLLAMGTSIEQVAPQMKMLGDIAGGVGADKLPQLVTAFGQVQTKGKLMGQEINQFAEAGVPLIEELAKSFGKTKAEVVSMSEKGQISAGQMTKALDNLAKNKFGELGAKQAETFAGKVAKLQDAWQVFLQGQGAKILEWAKKFIDIVTFVVTDILPRFANGINTVTEFLGKHKEILIFVGAAIATMLVPTLIGLATTFLTVVVPAIGAAIVAAAPLLITGAVIGGIVAGVYLIVKNWTLLSKVAGQVFTAIGNVIAAFGDDVWNAMKAIGSYLLAPFKALWQAITGDFEGAMNTIMAGFQGLMNINFNNTISAAKNAGGVLVDSFGEVKDAVVDSFKSTEKQAGDTAVAAVGAVNTITTATGGAISKGASKAGEAMKKVKEDYEKAVESATNSLTELENKHGQISADISGKIDDLKSKLKELSAAYKETTDSINKDEAEKVVEQEEKLKKLKDDIAMERQNLAGDEVESAQKLLELRQKLEVLRLREAEQKSNASGSSRESLDDQISANLADQKAIKDKMGSGSSRLDELQEQYQKELAAYDEYFIKGTVYLDEQLVEARRRASLTDFQRYIEDLNAKRAEAQADHDQKKLQIEEEITQQETSLQRERVVYLAKRQVYVETQTKFQQFHDAYKKNLENMNLATQKNVDDMQKKLEQLQKILASIESAKSEAGIASIIGFEGQSRAQSNQPVASPAQQNVTINLGGVTVTNEADENRLVDRITRALQLSAVGSQ